MFFYLSKTLWTFAEPSHALVALAIVGLIALWTGLARLARALLTLALGLILIVSVAPVGTWLLDGLESRFPAYDDEGPVDGIVLLGGTLATDLYFTHHGSGLSPAIGRVPEVTRLSKLYTNARIVVAGGPQMPGEEGRAEGDALKQLLVQFGVPAERVTLELNSRNTHENALFVKQLAAPKPGERWLVVTSAFHMPRAIACFRGVGFPVIADPVDFRFPDRAEFGFNPSVGLERLDLAFHEGAGLLTYWLSGKTKELFPAP